MVWASWWAGLVGGGRSSGPEAEAWPQTTPLGARRDSAHVPPMRKLKFAD